MLDVLLLTSLSPFAGQYIESAPLPTFDDRPDAFNDMAWQCFRQAAKSETDSDVDILVGNVKKLDI